VKEIFWKSTVDPKDLEMPCALMIGANDLCPASLLSCIDLVDLVGFEPTTSSMPWNWEKCKLLTAKVQKIDWVRKSRKNCRF
jgi:hypothetical protein